MTCFVISFSVFNISFIIKNISFFKFKSIKFNKLCLPSVMIWRQIKSFGKRLCIFRLNLVCSTVVWSKRPNINFFYRNTAKIDFLQLRWLLTPWSQHGLTSMITPVICIGTKVYRVWFFSCKRSSLNWLQSPPHEFFFSNEYLSHRQSLTPEPQ